MGMELWAIVPERCFHWEYSIKRFSFWTCMVDALVLWARALVIFTTTACFTYSRFMQSLTSLLNQEIYKGECRQWIN